MGDFTDIPRFAASHEYENREVAHDGPGGVRRQLGRQAASRTVIVSHPHDIAYLRQHHREVVAEPAQEGTAVPMAEADPLFEQLAVMYQDWMVDVRLAVQYGLHELRAGDIKNMTKKDAALLALCVDELLERIDVARHFIGASAGDVHKRPLLEQWYGAERTQDELVAYLEILRTLQTAIHSHELLRALHEAAPQTAGLSPKKRHDKLRKYGNVQLGYDQRHKPRVEPVSS